MKIGTKVSERVTSASTTWVREPASQSSSRLEWWMAWKFHSHGTWWKARCTQ